MSKIVHRYSDADLAEFQELIEKKLGRAREQLDQLQGQILEMTENNDSDYGQDMMDDSNTNNDVEMLNNLAIHQRKFIRELEAALGRIRNKTYGICEVTGELIDKKRLLAVPTTTKSLAAKLGVTPPPKPVLEEEDEDEAEDKSKSTRPQRQVITKVIRKPTNKKTAEKPPNDEEEDEPIINDEGDWNDEEDSEIPYQDMDSFADEEEY
jgi:RNA polymerase-binding transcription factor DksA